MGPGSSGRRVIQAAQHTIANNATGHGLRLSGKSHCRPGSGSHPWNVFNGTAGFHLNGLYSPWVDNPGIGPAILGDPSTPGLKPSGSFVNTVLAESWEDDAGEQVEHHDLR